MPESAPGQGDAGTGTRDPPIKPLSKKYLLNKSRKAARELAIEELGDSECHVCGATPIEIHHRNGDALDNRPINLIPLCHWHHRKAHRIPKQAKRVREWKESLPGGD